MRDICLKIWLRHPQLSRTWAVLPGVYLSWKTVLNEVEDRWNFTVAHRGAGAELLILFYVFIFSFNNYVIYLWSTKNMNYFSWWFGSPISEEGLAKRGFEVTRLNTYTTVWYFFGISHAVAWINAIVASIIVWSYWSITKNLSIWGNRSICLCIHLRTQWLIGRFYILMCFLWNISAVTIICKLTWLTYINSNILDLYLFCDCPVTFSSIS